MAGMLQMRRSRGAFSGFLLILLGLWGALIPFVGPYFHYAYTPDTAWTYNTARLWLELLPGAAVFLGGFLLMIAGRRHTALFVTLGGSPAGATVYTRIMEQLGFFSALGVVVVFIAAVAFGRIASVPAGIRTVEPVTETAPAIPADTLDDEDTRTLPTRTPAATTFTPTAKAENTETVG
jgi:peptidoglycan/LPS O-acetylase OafA/YrhL